MSTSIHSDVHTPPFSSDMRTLMENMQAFNVNNRQDDLSITNSTPLKEKGKHSMIPVRHYTPQSYHSFQSRSNTTETSDVCNLYSII
jgi:hypothetical protein